MLLSSSPSDILIIIKSNQGYNLNGRTGACGILQEAGAVAAQWGLRQAEGQTTNITICQGDYRCIDELEHTSLTPAFSPSDSQSPVAINLVGGCLFCCQRCNMGC